MTQPIPPHLVLYDSQYFAGSRAVSGYDDYANCVGVLNKWASMVEALVSPRSVLDVGAAYGFVVQYFLSRGVPAYGVEPSDFARSQAASGIADRIAAGSLPDLPDVITPMDSVGEEPKSRFDAVTCTEVLEHVPEELVPASLQALADRTDKFLICLVMLEGPGADGDEGHICLKSRAWWNEQFDATGMLSRPDLEAQLDNDPYSKSMYWQTRFFVRERVC